MRGLERLTQLRRGRLKPEIVHLDMPELGLSTGLPMEGQLVVEQGDNPCDQDLRVLHDLCVVATGMTGDIARIEQWARAAISAGARDVGLAVIDNNGGTDGPVWICRNGEVLA